MEMKKKIRVFAVGSKSVKMVKSQDGVLKNHQFFFLPKPQLNCFRWGYMILYLVVILGSLILNGLFLAVIKKCPTLHRTCHFLFACVAARDLIVTILVIPFVISSQVSVSHD